jgi:hypothetical protein
VNEIRNHLRRVARDFPEVRFAYADAVEALRQALALPAEPPCGLDISIATIDSTSHVMVVESKTPTFGPQPWLALKTSAGSYHHDNFDIDAPFHRWRYVFDEDTFPLQALSAVGVAANNAYGVTTVARLDVASGTVTKKHWNCVVQAD